MISVFGVERFKTLNYQRADMQIAGRIKNCFRKSETAIMALKSFRQKKRAAYYRNTYNAI